MSVLACKGDNMQMQASHDAHLPKQKSCMYLNVEPFNEKQAGKQTDIGIKLHQSGLSNLANKMRLSHSPWFSV